jgi:cytochrome P450
MRPTAVAIIWPTRPLHYDVGISDYPPPPLSIGCLKGAKLAGYELPNEIEIFAFPWLVHRRPGYYEDPHKFNPERRIGSHEKVERAKSFSFSCPFSLGNRNCVGLNLAYAGLRVAIPMALRRYNLKFADGTRPPHPIVYMAVCPTKANMALERRGLD